MTSRDPVIISGAFAIEFKLEDEWREYAAEAGIENPWTKYRKNIPEPIRSAIIVDGKEIPCWKTSFPDKKVKLVPDDEERIAYRRQEYLWKAKIIQPKAKWEDFADWVECREGIELADFRPCDSKDGVCTFTCTYFGEKCPFND